MTETKETHGELNATPELESRLGEFMTVEDVADLLRINKSTVYRMAKQGRIPATRVGRQWRFRLSSLEAFLDADGDVVVETSSETQDVKRVVNCW